MAALGDEYNLAESDEFPPLLPIGRHRLPLRRMREFCVTDFPDSPARNRLMQILEAIVERLKAGRIRGELWVGGSFVTEKPEPGDIDVVLRVRSAWLMSAAEQQLTALDWFIDELSDSEDVDNYFLVEWPRTHENYWVGEYWYAYWLRQWGFARDNSLKGIAVIQLGGR
jgi:hypothetical protein